MKVEHLLQESVNDRGIFKAIFLGGIPGAGKSTVNSNITDGAIQPKIVNTDKHIEFFGKKHAADLTTEFQKSFKDRSKILTRKDLVNYVNGALPLIIDSTSSNNSRTVKRMSMLENLGYDIGVVWINTDLETAIERVASRGRKVPEDFIRQSKALEADNKAFFKRRTQLFVEVDNNNTELDQQVILQAYKKTSRFFHQQVYNPIGIQTIKKLHEAGEKYLTPTILSEEHLDSLINIWYN